MTGWTRERPLRALPAANRVLYLLDGALTVDGKSVPVNGAWHGAGPCEAGAGPAGATVLRYELVGGGAAASGSSRCSPTTSRSIRRRRT